MRSAYAQHLRARQDAGELDWPIFLPKPPGATGSVLRAEARTLLGLGGNSFAKLLKTEMWADMEVVLSTIEGPEYRRADVIMLRTRLERLVSPEALDARLRIGAGRGVALCDAGLVPTVPWNRHSRNGVKRSASILDADHLLDEVRSKATDRPPERPVSFSALAQRATNRQVIDFADLMRSVLEGHPRAFVSYPEATGFDAFTFDEAEVVQVLDHLCDPLLCGKMLSGDAAKYLGVPPPALVDLTKLNLALRPFGKRRNLFLTADIHRVAARVVCDRHVPVRRPMSAYRIREMLAAAGVTPIVEVDVPGKGLAAVYLRGDVTRAAEHVPELGGSSK